MKTKPLTKYESLAYLLGQYGDGRMDSETFWKEMNGRGYTQADIDQWCEQYHQLEAKREHDDEERRRKKEQDRTARATASRHAGSPRREEQGDHRPQRPRDHNGAVAQGEGQRQAEAGQQGEGRRQEKAREDGTLDGEVWITLSQQEIAWVDRKSYKQAVARWNEGAQPQGGQPAILEIAIDEHRLGSRGEAGVRRWLGDKIKWRILEPLVKRRPGEKRKPDFGDDIDVKTVDYRRAQLWLTPNCPPDYIYILVSANMHPCYRIIGWCYGEEMMLQEYWNKDAPREPAWVINQDNPILKSPASLYEILRTRGDVP